MKRKQAVVLVFFLLLVLLPMPAQAAITLHGMDISVYLQENGDGHVTMYYESTQDSTGTENYIPIENLGDSTIRDFRVSEEGRNYTENRNWDSDESRAVKNDRYGLLNTSRGVELVWGIGEPGRHRYKLEYTITGLVKNLDDAQALFWQFVNYDMSNPPEQVRLRVTTDFPITEENARIWAFGFRGTIHFVEGGVLAETNKPLRSSNYVTALIVFDTGTFSTTARDPRSFSELQERAFEGSDYEIMDEEEVYDVKRSSPLFPGIFAAVMAAPGVIIGIIGTVLLMFWGARSDEIRARSYRPQFKGEYEREVPFHDPLEEDFYLLNRMRITGVKEQITAWLLKWILEGQVEQISVEEGWLFKKDATALRLPEDRTKIPDGEMEGRFYRLLEQAAGNDRVLSSREFTRWVQKNISSMTSWEKELLSQSRETAVQNGYYAYEGRKKKPRITQKGEDFEVRVHKFHNYLSDFSLFAEREAAQVRLWDYLMITAALMGITDKVEKEFRKLYPEYEMQSTYAPGTVIWAHTYANSIHSSYHTSSSSSSGGGGGSSSSGGGGGSFGGGGGGGTR